jgi:hypothetical protein
MSHPETHNGCSFGSVGRKVCMPLENRIRTRLKQPLADGPIGSCDHHRNRDGAGPGQGGDFRNKFSRGSRTRLQVYNYQSRQVTSTIDQQSFDLAQTCFRSVYPPDFRGAVSKQHPRQKTCRMRIIIYQDEIGLTCLMQYVQRSASVPLNRERYLGAGPVISDVSMGAHFTSTGAAAQWTDTPAAAVPL